MYFLVDAQLPPALAKWITSQGHSASHVFDVGLEGADDRTIWTRAITRFESLLPVILEALGRGEGLVELE